MDHSPKETSLAASIANQATATTADTGEDLRLGALLVRNSVITRSQIGPILARARKERVPFGQAAVRAGLITEKELNRTLGIQFRHKLAEPGHSRISTEVVTAFRSDHAVANEIRSLRSQLLLQWLDGKHPHNRTLAIVSPNRADGRSFLAANLATAFSQSGHRTLLIDADLRRPRQHRLFGLANRSGFSSVLSGRAKESFVYRLHDLPGLSILTAGGIPPNPTELLVPGMLESLFAKCAKKYHVVIVDTPAAQETPDAGLIASQTSGYLMLGKTGTTAFDTIKELSSSFDSMGANLVGSIMSGE